MKISYRTHPILKRLHEGKLGNMPVYDFDAPNMPALTDYFNKYWKANVANFSSSINVVSMSFIDAMEKAEKSLIKLYGDIITEDINDFNCSGTYVIGNTVCMIHQSFKGGSDSHELFFYQFTKEGIPLMFKINSFKFDMKYITWLSNYYEAKHGDKKNIGRISYSIMFGVIIAYMFKNFAQIETKYLAPHTKKKEVGCKYINDTQLNLTFLDSKWFTNLVKSDDFKVRGHFRLQPKIKDGEWIKELIWINDFVKHGYYSPAKKLTRI